MRPLNPNVEREDIRLGPVQRQIAVCTESSRQARDGLIEVPPELGVQRRHKRSTRRHEYDVPVVDGFAGRDEWLPHVLDHSVLHRHLRPLSLGLRFGFGRLLRRTLHFSNAGGAVEWRAPQRDAMHQAQQAQREHFHEHYFY